MISHAILKLLIAETAGPCASAPARVNVMADITHTHTTHTHTCVCVVCVCVCVCVVCYCMGHSE